MFAETLIVLCFVFLYFVLNVLFYFVFTCIIFNKDC